MFAREIMNRPVVAVDPGTPVREATALLIEHGFAGLPVVGDGNQVVGIFTEADALRADTAASDPVVGQAMTTPVEVVSPGTEASHITRHMLTDRLRCVPVADDGVLVG